MRLTILVALLLVCLGCTESPAAKAEKFQRQALSVSKQFVEQRLRSPSTAKHPYLSDKGVQVAPVTGKPDEYLVRAYVDSQNAFGAMLRLEYICQVRHTGGNNWQLVELLTGDDLKALGR